ncbi:MAG: hypothetical protein ACRDYX_15710 [Egibacteraceae bacterium]
MRQNLRRAHPEATAEDIEQLLRDWINHRPGAEWGTPRPRALSEAWSGEA